MNITASSSIAIATVFDIAVWYYVKDLVVFDKKEKGSPKANLEGEAEKETKN